MSVLVGGTAGASARLGGGLSAVNPIAVSDVPPQEMMRARGLPALGTRAGKFSLTITGVTKDAVGTPLGGCAVYLFDTATNTCQRSTVSDANGAYEFTVYAPTVPYYVVSYKAGAPDVAGTTVNTLIGS